MHGLDRIKEKYPQTFAVPAPHGGRLIVVPGYPLGEGWNKSICTVLFIEPPGFPGACPHNFWVDIPDLGLSPVQHERREYHDGEVVNIPLFVPCYTNRLNPIPGFPEWKELTWFKWCLQSWHPNRDDLFTYMMVIRNRLKPAR